MPFRMLMAGDFAGAARQRPGAPIEVDRDNFHSVIARLRPVIELPIAGPDGQPVTIAVQELEDLDPDRIWQKLPMFRAIRATALPDMQPDRSVSTNLLDDVLASTAATYSASEGDAWKQTIESIASRYSAPKPTPAEERRSSDVQRAAELLMQAILHAAPFRALETAWRGLDLVVRRVDTGEDVKIFIADMPKARVPELFGDAGDGWSVVLGNFSFGPSDSDLKLLGNIARAAAEAKTPFVAGGHRSLLGCDENDEVTDPREWKLLPEAAGALWQALRRSPEAAWAGLAFPRFLVRLPYGKELASTDEFPFEETHGNFSHRDFAWANPIFACAAMLGESANKLEDMPACTWRSDGELRFQPPGEVLLTDRAAEAVLERGLIPLMSSKHGNEIRAPRFQSIADPPLELEFPDVE